MKVFKLSTRTPPHTFRPLQQRSYNHLRVHAQIFCVPQLWAITLSASAFLPAAAVAAALQTSFQAHLGLTSFFTRELKRINREGFRTCCKPTSACTAASPAAAMVLAAASQEISHPIA
eukprot:3029758-Amphidinium_carterae.1